MTLARLSSARCGLRWALVVAAALFAAGIATGSDADAEMPSELVFVTEDFAKWPYDQRHFGCDSISVFSAGPDRELARGWQQVSPGRIAVNPQQTVALASQSNTRRFLYTYSRRDDAATRWSTGRIEGAGFATLGGLAFLPDGDEYLVATESSGEDWFGEIRLPNFPPYYVQKFKLPPSLNGQRNVGRSLGRMRISGIPLAIIVSSSGELAHVVTSDVRIHTMDPTSMTEVSASIYLGQLEGPRDTVHGTPINALHATISSDERYLIVNRWSSSEIHVADLDARRAWTLSTRDGAVVGGVALNRGWLNRDLLAVHEKTQVSVYGFEPAGPLRIMSSQDIAPPEIGSPVMAVTGPLLAVKWSESGSRIIAATSSGSSEFAIIEVSDGGRRMSESALVEVCDEGMNGPNDIWTANGLVTPPVTVTPRASPTPTKTYEPRTGVPSPSATHTASAANTPRPSPSTAPKPTDTRTAQPRPLYLPLLLREHCNPEHERSDIALVIDTSSSMTGRKIEDARAAALAFVGLIDLAPGRSQVAVVRFDREPEVMRELTNARALIEASIRNLQVRSGTHIDKGLRAALGELRSPRHLERNTQVLILLTDGVQTGTPGEELRAAEEVHAASVRVYTIGLGADVDEATLRTIAGADERYFFAPDSGDLAHIYGEIARDLMCPGVDLWGGR